MRHKMDKMVCDNVLEDKNWMLDALLTVVLRDKNTRNPFFNEIENGSKKHKEVVKKLNKKIVSLVNMFRTGKVNKIVKIVNELNAAF